MNFCSFAKFWFTLKVNYNISRLRSNSPVPTVLTSREFYTSSSKTLMYENSLPSIFGQSNYSIIETAERVQVEVRLVVQDRSRSEPVIKEIVINRSKKVQAGSMEFILIIILASAGLLIIGEKHMVFIFFHLTHVQWRTNKQKSLFLYFQF